MRLSRLQTVCNVLKYILFYFKRSGAVADRLRLFFQFTLYLNSALYHQNSFLSTVGGVKCLCGGSKEYIIPLI